MKSPILTFQEAAKYMRLGEKELKRLVDNGHIAFLNPGLGTKKPRRKFHRADLDEYLNGIKEKKCPSSRNQNQASITTHSTSNVIDIMGQLV